MFLKNKRLIKANCSKCGAIFVPKSLGALGRGYCLYCDDCRNKNCPVCGNLFRVKAGNPAVCCSHKCMGVLKRKNVVNTTCAVCGKLFRPSPYRKNTQKTCSHKCKNELRKTADPVKTRLRRRLHNRVWFAFSRKHHRKYKKTQELTGCNVAFLARWLESQFASGMTWANYGKKWHIDHIVPCNAFDLSNEEQAKKCFHWTNLRPLPKFENLSKHAKIQQAQLGLLLEIK